MQSKTLEFAVESSRDKVITKVGKSSVLQPKPNYKGGSTKWYQDKQKAESEAKKI